MEGGLDPEMIQRIKASMKADPAAAAGMIKQIDLDNIPLNIGIIGETGSGKSSFVNAFRGMRNTDPGASSVGVNETTKDIRSYLHPNYNNVILWDLPGIGAPCMPRDTYVKNMKLDKGDFFIIVSDTHCRENDVTLAKEIQKMGKKFYFVHSKIDQTLTNEKENNLNSNAESTIQLTRKRCAQGLEKKGFKQPQIFLLSSFKHQQHDFPLLHEIFTREMNHLKMCSLLPAMAAIHLEVINEKKKDYQDGIKIYATASAAGAALPIPGLSVALDVGMIVKAVNDYVSGFGLDSSSLHRLASSTGVPYDDLKFSIKSVLVKEKITIDLILKLLTQLGSTSVLLATEEWTRFIPILGIPIAAGLSFTVTYQALNVFLDELGKEAHEVFKRVLRMLTGHIKCCL